MVRRFLLVFLAGLWMSTAFAADELIHHEITAELNPAEHHLKVVDQITLPSQHLSNPVFYLHRGLQPHSSTLGVKIIPIKQSQSAMVEKFKLVLPADAAAFSIEYEGVLHHPLESYGKEQARGFRDTPGVISDEGIYLADGSYWYPEFDTDTRLSFDLSVKLPEGWKSVSQGENLRTDNKDNWRSPQPQEEIYLIAAQFTRYTRTSEGPAAMVYLRQADEALANKYLDATDRYLAMYAELLGDYPYQKFALVENFWETGFGMPSFTLLGSSVIRLPFILNSSYPHEILHNWWGNGVYVDYATGNWSEGLTAYLADHLIKEQQGQGAAYRQQSLQKYTDYAAKGRDFPLIKFRGRHSSASEAVGYGKALMLFHMLRRELGDVNFSKGLRVFYQQFQFKTASYEDLRSVFEEAAGKPLAVIFKQWTERTGAPALALSDVRKEKTTEGYRLSFRLQQQQADNAYQLCIPLAVTMEGQEQAWQTEIEMNQKQQDYAINLPAKPMRIDIDPEFDLFRKLAQDETPAAFTELFGSQQMLVVLPAEAKVDLLKAYKAFAADLQKMGPDEVIVKLDSEIESLPPDQAVTVIGWNNRFYKEFTTALDGYDIHLASDSIKIEGKDFSTKALSLALTARRSNSKKSPISFIASALPEALPGLGRKLPHYHKFSYLAFTGAEPQNKLKGRWPVTHSPMTALLEGSTEQGELSKREALAQLPAEFDAERMMETIRFLSADELKGRGLGDVGLDRTAEYIAQQFKQAGLVPAGDKAGTYFQTWQEKGGEPSRNVMLKNIIGVIPAVNASENTETIVIGAHYDHLGLGWPDVRSNNQGKIHPGADDNASGVAVLLELARTLAGKIKPARNIIFIAFSGEETGRLGSKHFLMHSQTISAKNIVGMINLDTVGRLGNNKLLVLGGNSAREWPHIFNGIGYVTGIPITNVTQQLDSSDQVSFQEVGIPAVQLFSGVNPDYHRPSDTADKIDTEGLVKIAKVTTEAISYLASKEATLTSSTQPSNSKKGTVKSQRKVSLGSIPDFTYTGKGYRLSGVTPESPAAVCGLQKDDVIVKIKDKTIVGLKDVSNILKSMRPGDSARIVYQRNSKERSCKAFLVEK